MIRRLLLALAVLAPVTAQAADYAVRDETTRLAVAVLGRICLMNLGDVNAVITAAAPGGEFGFVEAPADVAAALLQGKQGYVRVLRRPGLGAVTVTITRDGICSVYSEWGEATALQRHLLSMVERGGLKGGAQLLALESKEQGGSIITDYYLVPTNWYAAQLSKRFGDDGGQPLALVTSLSAPNRRPMELVLSVSRQLKP